MAPTGPIRKIADVAVHPPNQTIDGQPCTRVTVRLNSKVEIGQLVKAAARLSVSGPEGERLNLGVSVLDGPRHIFSFSVSAFVDPSVVRFQTLRIIREDLKYDYCLVDYEDHL